MGFLAPLALGGIGLGLGGGFNAPKSQVNQAPLLTPEQREWMKELAGFLMPQVGQAGPSYPGERVAPLSPLQTGAFGLAGTQGLESIQNLLGGGWMTPITTQAENLWNRTIMPSIMNQQAAMDAAGSGGTVSRLALAGQDLSTQLAGQLAPLSLSATQMGLGGLGSLAGLGGMQQAQNQAEINALIQKWTEQQPIYSPVMSQLPLLFGQQAENIVTQKPAGIGYSLLTGMLGGVGGGLGQGIGNWLGGLF